MQTTLRFAAIVAAAALIAVSPVACKKSTVTGEHGEKLSIYEPAAVTLRRGSTAKVDLKIKRVGLTGDVAISFSDLPQGVEVVDSDSKIAVDDGTYTLRASDTADLVEKSVARVTATGRDGVGVTTTMSVSVKEKDKL